MIKFDLQKALRGEPVVLRNGLKAYIRHRETELETAPLLGFFMRDGSLGIGAWEECGANYWSRRTGESDYDIIGMWTEPLEFKHWDLLTEDIKCLAKDRTGHWYGYSGKPTKKDGCWDAPPDSGCYIVNALNSSIFPECNWENSLIERPENV